MHFEVAARPIRTTTLLAADFLTTLEILHALAEQSQDKSGTPRDKKFPPAASPESARELLLEIQSATLATLFLQSAARALCLAALKAYTQLYKDLSGTVGILYSLLPDPTVAQLLDEIKQAEGGLDSANPLSLLPGSNDPDSPVINLETGDVSLLSDPGLDKVLDLPAGVPLPGGGLDISPGTQSDTTPPPSPQVQQQIAQQIAQAQYAMAWDETQIQAAASDLADEGKNALFGNPVHGDSVKMDLTTIATKGIDWIAKAIKLALLSPPDPDGGGGVNDPNETHNFAKALMPTVRDLWNNFHVPLSGSAGLGNDATQLNAMLLHLTQVLQQLRQNAGKLFNKAGGLTDVETALDPNWGLQAGWWKKLSQAASQQTEAGEGLDTLGQQPSLTPKGPSHPHLSLIAVSNAAAMADANIVILKTRTMIH